MANNMKITFLSGGTGTPKLLLGFRELLSDEELTIIGNTGDDDEFFGILVSPDIDTLLYLFSEQLDLDKFWGVKNETFSTLQQLSNLEEETWFKLGDKDLALHLTRNNLLSQGFSLTEIVKILKSKLKIKANILPMSNNAIRTTMITENNEYLTFQEYTVKYHENPSIKEVVYLGYKKAKPSSEVISAINNSQAIIIGPSNPITSISPMLAMRQLKKALRRTDAKIIAISPLSNGKAFSGPAAQLMKELKIEPTSLGIASLYKEFLDIIIISKSDNKLKQSIEELGIEVIEANISLNTESERKDLAKIILNRIN